MPRDPQRPPAFFRPCETEAGAIHDARRAFLDWLRGWVEDREMHEEMLVVLSELMANAIDASKDPRGDIVVRAWVDSRDLVLDVVNPPAAAFAVENRWDYDDPLRAGGRGLLIVESLVDDIAIAPPNGREPLSVRCRRHLPASP